MMQIPSANFSSMAVVRSIADGGNFAVSGFQYIDLVST
jgi:hypothetical protein